MAGGQGEKHVLVSPGMKISHDISKFGSVGGNKERSFELILHSIVDERENLESRVVYFSSIETCTRVSSTSVCLF